MKAFLIALCAGLLGGVVGAGGVHWLSRGGSSGPAASSDDAALREVRDALAAVERRLERPGLATAGPAESSPAAGGKPSISVAPEGGPAAHAASGARLSLSAEEIKAIAAEAADAALEKRDAKEKAAAKAEEKKKATLAEAARELALTAAQENELRAVYSETTEKYLKLFAEPEQTPDELRRELEAVKGDPVKKAALTVKYMPKLMAKLGDVMAIEMEKIAEEDPFGFEDGEEAMNVTLGVSSDGG